MPETNKLSFRISTGLKNIIGRDLISNEYIAIFELVKNSYDAGASKVNIEFTQSPEEGPLISISDNGCGMNYDDITQKWLFVAYSEKKVRNRTGKTFRDEIKREAAGAKGVGRFSCDRLGEMLHMVTKTSSDQYANAIDVNWNNFEVDDTQEFMEVPVKYSIVDSLPSCFKNGTTLIIKNLREDWDRDSILRLKRSLMKLISPDANLGEIPFEIEIIAKHELENDNIICVKQDVNLKRDIVNGLVENDIFEKLNIKTTNIDVSVSEDGKTITSKLSDRGQYIFEIKEKNRTYSLLQNIHISVFYLNRSAKMSFTRQMGGVQPVNYGSIFIYKNGFRINPYGETGQDFFNIDQRKAQGYNRYLGTREVMGRISIKGDNDRFIETSSRAHGFVQTPAVSALQSLFLEKALKVLEKYVVNIISWGEPIKSESNHMIEPKDVGDAIISQFVTNVNPQDVISIDYNEDLLKNGNTLSNPDNIKTSLKKLEIIAEKTQDTGLKNLANRVKERTEAILSYNLQLEAENTEKEKELDKERQTGAARAKQVYFLKGASNQNVENLINGFHTIYALTDATKGNIDFLKELIIRGDKRKQVEMLEIVSEILQSNEKAHKLAELAIHGNQALKQDGHNSINDFIRQYIDTGLIIKGLSYNLLTDEKAYSCKFDASSIGVILDNIASNSVKAGATRLDIAMIETAKQVDVSFTDDGIGVSESINPDMLFEWGVTSNAEGKGFGIGLYHIKTLLTEMQGSVYIDTTYKNGFRLVVRLKK